MKKKTSPTPPRLLPKGTKVALCRYGDAVVLQNQAQMRAATGAMQALIGRPQMLPWATCLLCTAGEMTVTVDYRTFRCTPAAMLMVLPQQIVELGEVSDNYEGLCILMSEEFTFSLHLADTLRTRLSIQREPFYLLGDRQLAAFENIFDMMQELMQHGDNPYLPKLMQLLTETCFYGFGYYLHMSTDTRDKNTAEFVTEQYLRCVERDFKTHHTVEPYAAQLCLSKKHLSACVKKATGRSAVEWIERHVVLYAQQMMEEKSLTVKEIADALHFPSQSFFGRYFKRIVGMSPSAYRSSLPAEQKRRMAARGDHSDDD